MSHTTLVSRNFEVVPLANTLADMSFKQCYGFYHTPPLWPNEEFGIRQFVFPEIDLGKVPLQKLPDNLRLGHQMEAVFEQLISHSKEYGLVVQNLAVEKDKRTLGEIDFILKDLKTGRTVHVELTYKFYLIDPDIPEAIDRLVGPNRRDTFRAKIEKIRDKQFPLLHSKSGVATLSKNHIDPEEIEHQACFKAQLFTPYSDSKADIAPLNKDCIKGYWIRFSDFEKEGFKNYTYYLPRKPEWVVEAHKEVEWSPYPETLREVKLHIQHKNAPMLWLKKSDTEFEKLFVAWW